MKKSKLLKRPEKSSETEVEVLPREEAVVDKDIDDDVIAAEVTSADNEPSISTTLPIPAEETGALPAVPSTQDGLGAYIREIARYPLIDLEEEQRLAKELHDTGDIEVAKKLVLANLRLVVKIAMEYRSSYQNVLDLIQEGNIGLMKAVSKYDPEKGAKLSYYASWWIRSYILKFILDNFRLIKIGTTQEKKKLFYNLMREKNRLMSQGINPDSKTIAENLGVSEKAVVEMGHRLGPHGGEVSLDTPVGEDGVGSLGDLLASDSESIEEQLAHGQELKILEENLGEFLSGLKERDRDIFQKRLLSEVPPSLQNIAEEYGVSRERIRQIEERLLKKLRVYMEQYLG